jgi:hypothetical protein
MLQTMQAPIKVGEGSSMDGRRLRGGSRPIDLEDLEGIFSDIVDTAISRAAGIPCLIDEYREGLRLMVSRLTCTIDSLPRFDA